MPSLFTNIFRSMSGTGLARQVQAPPTAPEHEDERMVPLRNLLKGPRIYIQIGVYPDDKYFYVPKGLLTRHSTTLRTSLRLRGNGIPNPVTFPGVELYTWVTFEAWLYEQNLNSLRASIVSVDAYEKHLVRVYAFAQDYRIDRLSEQVVALVKQRGVPITCSALQLAIRILEKESALYRVLVEAEAASFQRPQHEIGQLPATFVREAMRVARAINHARHANI